MPLFSAGPSKTMARLSGRQRAERHVGATPIARHIVGHERPHQAVPRSHALRRRLRLVGHECRAVYGHDRARTAALAARSAAVERQLLGSGSVEPMAAVPDEFFLGRDGQRRHGNAPQAGQRCEASRENINRRLLSSSVPCRMWLRMPGTPGRWWSAMAAGTYAIFIDLRLGGLRHAPARVGGRLQ